MSIIKKDKNENKTNKDENTKPSKPVVLEPKILQHSLNDDNITIPEVINKIKSRDKK